MRPERALAMLWIGCCVSSAEIAAQVPRPTTDPDIVLLGGRIFTADPSHAWAQALAIRGDRIIAVGGTQAVRALVGPNTRTVQLAGHVVIPGINDAHDHIGSAAPHSTVFHTSSEEIENPPLRQVLDSIAVIVERTSPGTWLTADIGRGVLMDTNARRTALDRVAPRHPVMLTSFTGHAAILNSAALRAVGIPDDARDPVGGWYERDGLQRLNGVLQEYAVWDAQRRLLTALPERVQLEALRKYAEATLRYGITTVQDMANDYAAATTVRLFHDADLPFRVRIIRMPMTDTSGRLVSEWASVDIRPASLTTVNGWKWILEGTGVERTALKRSAYPGFPGQYGRLDFPVDTIRAMLAEALHSREQLMLHIGGDSAIKLVLGLMQSLAPDSAWRPLRVRFEHGDGMVSDLVPAARRLGVIVVQNPTHFDHQPFRSLLRRGIPIAIGSDGARNPFLNIMLAVTREEEPSESITREQAVTAYTHGSAFAEFMERDKGMLAPGMLADIAVLSQDIFTVRANKLPATVSILSMVGGKVVYDAGVLVSNPRR